MVEEKVEGRLSMLYAILQLIASPKGLQIDFIKGSSNSPKAALLHGNGNLLDEAPFFISKFVKACYKGLSLCLN